LNSTILAVDRQSEDGPQVLLQTPSGRVLVKSKRLISSPEAVKLARLGSETVRENTVPAVWYGRRLASNFSLLQCRRSSLLPGYCLTPRKTIFEFQICTQRGKTDKNMGTGNSAYCTGLLRNTGIPANISSVANIGPDTLYNLPELPGINAIDQTCTLGCSTSSSEVPCAARCRGKGGYPVKREALSVTW